MKKDQSSSYLKSVYTAVWSEPDVEVTLTCTQRIFPDETNSIVHCKYVLLFTS